MVFTTYHFIFIFLPLVLAAYYASARLTISWMKTLVLTVTSYIFYAWDRPDYLALILVSTVLDWFCGQAVANRENPRRKLALWISICGNLGLLAYFKYFNLAADTVNVGLDALGIEVLEYTKVVLPVGISFYTFQTMSYTIDIYRGVARPARHPLDMACYVALFPQLVAGPIVRYSDLDDQLREREHSLEKFGRGAQLFMCGFAKKILLADSAARFADVAFAETAPGAAAAWLGIVGYSLQIYYDFSGYSDMARGLGNMVGFEFPINFASPYRSRSITEFWQRWHISLSTWLRDYLYIPLGGNRSGSFKTWRNLAITMLLGGLWHGAQWTFLVWGAFHGLMLGIERAMGKQAPWRILPHPFQIALTCVLVMIGWVFFRAPSFPRAIAMFHGMSGFAGMDGGLEPLIALDPTHYILAGAGLLLLFAGIQSDRMIEKRGVVGALVAPFLFVTFALALAHMFFQEYSPFIYFQF